MADLAPQTPSDKVLYMVSLSPDPGYEAKFNDWYNNEHLPELLACPGFENARRFQLIDGMDGSKKYLALYQVTSMATFSSAEYRALSNRTPDDLSPLAREVLPHRTMDLSGKYREIYRLDR